MLKLDCKSKSHRFTLSSAQLANTFSKLTIETLDHGVFIVKFEHISHIFLVFPLLTLSR